jgi:hypothetical protein
MPPEIHHNSVAPAAFVSDPARTLVGANWVCEVGDVLSERSP